jgi:flagellar M-ring protein FliF
VPELTNKAVSVVDSTGALLSGPGDDEAAQGLDSQQLQFRRELEAGLHKRVLALLEPVVGGDNVRVSITGDLDFSQVMQTAEAYRPNQGEDAKPAIREQRTEESSQPGSATPAGIPGATSNQPPVAATAPINGASQALQGTQIPGGVGGGAQRKEAATRFEVDKTVTVTRNAVGTVRRLSAAVVVNHRSSTDAKGKTTTAPLSEKEIEQLTALVQQGIGFNAERGDVVKVVNAPFRQDVQPKVEEMPVWQQPWLLDLLKSAAAPLALALVALVIIGKLIKPAVSAVLNPPQPAPGSQLDEVVADDAPTPNAPPALMAPDAADQIAQARALAKANPVAVANIVRGWVNGEA